jgi:hypothetical protein
VWLYSFDRETPVFSGKLKAFHALDVPFVFETIDAVGATDRGEIAHDLSRRIAATWTAFARNGKPDNPAIPHWPAYAASDRATLVLDCECRIENDYGREPLFAFRIWQRSLLRPRRYRRSQSRRNEPVRSQNWLSAYFLSERHRRPQWINGERRDAKVQIEAAGMIPEKVDITKYLQVY